MEEVKGSYNLGLGAVAGVSFTTIASPIAYELLPARTDSHLISAAVGAAAGLTLTMIFLILLNGFAAARREVLRFRQNGAD